MRGIVCVIMLPVPVIIIIVVFIVIVIVAIVVVSTAITNIVVSVVPIVIVSIIDAIVVVVVTSLPSSYHPPDLPYHIPSSYHPANPITHPRPTIRSNTTTHQNPGVGSTPGSDKHLTSDVCQIRCWI